MAKAIDKYLGLKWLKGEVDAKCKEAEAQAIDDLATLTGELGVTEMTSTVFGEEAGRLKYSKVRAKKVVEFNVDASELEDWVNENPQAAQRYAVENARAFAEWWFDLTGELADGAARVEYEEPAKTGPAKLYGFNAEAVAAVVGSNWLEGMDQLMLGDGE